jgi:hypothetical protein
MRTPLRFSRSILCSWRDRLEQVVTELLALVSRTLQTQDCLGHQAFTALVACNGSHLSNELGSSERGHRLPAPIPKTQMVGHVGTLGKSPPYLLRALTTSRGPRHRHSDQRKVCRTAWMNSCVMSHAALQASTSRQHWPYRSLQATVTVPLCVAAPWVSSAPSCRLCLISLGSASR